MITLKTKLLLILVAVCGLGIGVLAPFSDGLYSAILLFAFPFLAAFMAISVGIDLSRTPEATVREPVRERRQIRLDMQMPVVTSQKVN